MKEVTGQFIYPLDATTTHNDNLLTEFELSLKSKLHHALAAKVNGTQQQHHHAQLHHQIEKQLPQCSTRTVDEIIRGRLYDGETDFEEAEDAFFVGDMGEVVRQHAQFQKLLPRVEPFYAVKCNPDPMVLKTLSGLGTGFDCASKGEIQMAIEQGTPASKIIYANPCKQASHIRYAAQHGVTMMTFDNADELKKIKQIHPNPQMILRIRTDDSKSICRLGTKFGAAIENVEGLLSVAKELDMEVIGISFHVGSGCFDASAFGEAVYLARKAFDIGATLGFNFTLLDVGGGFPGNGTDGVTFPQIAAILGPAIDEHFDKSVRVIAEPGRYYVSSAFTLVVNVIARRVVSRDSTSSSPPTADDHPSYMYYINDGMYGSFNCITFDHAVVYPKVLSRNTTYLYRRNDNHSTNPVPDGFEQPSFQCSIWGPTCDSIDCIGKEFALPCLEVGDWMYFENMGAYTMCAASQFNGFRKSALVYTNTADL
ncbi:hypothetical protein HK097_002656 [Rhizophlyctis rosea]|uniref:ornithine decarboxylase n=1 Tax=Rhizophlyctis rosea TaxID=64517 RepID=A0AAD5S346_9FUNG|nr:hypothetical protein HK097_002656 [Rhizophlyctis rosea]